MRQNLPFSQNAILEVKKDLRGLAVSHFLTVGGIQIPTRIPVRYPFPTPFIKRRHAEKNAMIDGNSATPV